AVARIAKGTPAALGFRQPAEWETHRATWLGWPHHAEDWPGKLPAIVWVYTEIIRRLARHEQVSLLVQNARGADSARAALGRAGVDLTKVELVTIPTDRAWMRDSAPSFVKSDGEIAVVDWAFNGWAKYENHLRDDRVPARIAEHRALRRFVPKAPGQGGGSRVVVLEGGSIDLDGEGTMLTTEECLLSEVQQRNPGLSRADLERYFADYLGVERVLWLGRGIAGDDTHGHVDDLARFVRPGVVVIAREKNTSDENYEPLAENLERLRAMTDFRGRKLEVVELPMPAPVAFDAVRLPASYANFYIANDLVLVPTFNDPNDRVALGILAELFPGREVVGIHATDLVWGLGTLHCMSHEEPI
ncbi:MAG TPA: agmatine deiminase family protein, partial [Polyangiaceae bacterium]|nr:agmatine deiminase family protein [Polyangiaceae bacterium]